MRAAFHHDFALPAIFLGGLLASAASIASETALFFESPVDGAMVKDRTTSLRLRANNFQDTSDSQLTVEISGLDPVACGLDTATGIGNCSLSQNLPDGWQSINATLSDGEMVLAQSAISIAVDSDEDGVPNHEDSCANSPLEESVDEQGCAPSQVDTDGDGISDGEETAAGSDPESPESFPAIEIRAFSALPEQISRVGDSAGLSWSVQGATSVRITNDADDTRLSQLPSIGAARVSPEITTTYTLSAEGPAGSTSLQVQVVVTSSQPENQWGESPLEQVPEAISASLTVMGDGAAYLGAFDGNYYRFTPNGSLEWTLENIGVAMNQAAVSGNLAFVGTNSAEGGHIFSLNADKSQRWELHTDSGIIASPVLNTDASVVYVACYDGTILGLSTADGSERWRFKLPDGESVSATPMLNQDGSILYVHSNNHQVYALGTSSATLKALGEGQSSSPLIWQSDLASSPGN